LKKGEGLKSDENVTESIPSNKISTKKMKMKRKKKRILVADLTDDDLVYNLLLLTI
jgi:hypothetical protein